MIIKMRKYYSEEIEKDTKYRADYLTGIERFLFDKKSEADRLRSGFISPEKYLNNGEYYRNALVQMLGFPLGEQREMPSAEKKFIAQDDNVNIYRMQFGLSSGLKFYAIYFEQKENAKEAPFIFGFHGGDGTPEIVSSIYLNSANYHHLVRRMTDKGANVIAPQLLLWDTKSYGNEYKREHIDGKLRQLGGSVTALELYLLQCVLDYFIEKESINESKIGVAGLSYGGMYAIHFAAIDVRIKACYSCSWVNDCWTNSWADWSYFNAQKRFTTAETAALIAPRALVVAMGDKDELFAYQKTVAECEKIVLYYRVLHAEDKFQSVIFDGKHEADKDGVEIDFLLKNL